MSATGTGSLLNVTEELIRASEETDQDARRLSRLVDDIEANQLAPYVLGDILGLLLFITLFGVTGPFLTSNYLATVSVNTIFFVGASTQLILILFSALGFKRFVYDERRDQKIEELRSLMSLIDPGYRSAFEALKERDPDLAKKIVKYVKCRQSEEAVK